MENYFTDNFVDYDDPPIDNSSLSGDNHEFSLTSPNSDSTGLYPSSYSPPATNYQATEQPVFDIMGYYNSEQPDIQNQTGPLIPEKSKRGGRKKAQPAETPVKTESQNDSSSEDKILEKSKRIQKREIAKERTKQKTDLATLFQGVDVKFLPEGYDDPNLDERTKKKMIQMVRNRISAQNSRDRKKGYMTQLEEQNAQLEANYAALKEERDLLASQLEAAQNELEILRNRGTASCSNCLRTEKEEDFLVTNNGDDNNLLNDIPAGGFSGLSSPRLVRFASSRTSLFGMFAFTCFIGMIALSGMGQQDALGMQGSGLKEVRRLEVDQALASSSVIENKDYINLQIPDYSKSLMIQNINQIMAQFEKSYEPTFKSHLEKSSIFNNVSLQESMKVIEKVIEPEVEKEVKNGLVQYGSAKLPRFRKNVAPAIINTPPALNNDPLTSTLFCHSGQEFYGNENVQYSNKGELARNNSLDLEKAEYLQLLVPKGTITRSNVNNRFNDIYGQTLYNEEKSDDDTMLEIWCKVFMVREMGTSF